MTVHTVLVFEFPAHQNWELFLYTGIPRGKENKHVRSELGVFLFEEADGQQPWICCVEGHTLAIDIEQGILKN